MANLTTNEITEQFGTHFVDNGTRTAISRYSKASTPLIHAFKLDNCERCGQIVEAPNTGIKLGHTVEELKGFGMVELPHRLSELGYSEKLDMAICDSCFAKEDDLAN